MEVYKNLKNGKLYEILYMALNTTNSGDGQEMVVYKPIDKNDLIFVRDAREFFTKFKSVS